MALAKYKILHMDNDKIPFMLTIIELFTITQSGLPWQTALNKLRRYYFQVNSNFLLDVAQSTRYRLINV